MCGYKKTSEQHFCHSDVFPIAPPASLIIHLLPYQRKPILSNGFVAYAAYIHFINARRIQYPHGIFILSTSKTLEAGA